MTTSRMCRTDVRPACLLAFEFSMAARARRAASQSKCELRPVPTDRAEKGERAVVGVATVCALIGESSGLRWWHMAVEVDGAGDTGMCRPGNVVPVTGAEVGRRPKGLGGGRALAGVVTLHEAAVLGNAYSAESCRCRCGAVLLLPAVVGADSGVHSPLLVVEVVVEVVECVDDDDDVVVVVVVVLALGPAPVGEETSSLGGRGSDMAFRKSTYAVGGEMGVLSAAENGPGPHSSILTKGYTALSGVLTADSAESCDGNVAVTGVVSCASLGLFAAGMVAAGDWRRRRGEA